MNEVRKKSAFVKPAIVEAEKKAAKKAEHDREDASDDVRQVIIQFHSTTGDAAGPQLEVPVNISPDQLHDLLNNLLQNEEPLPYAFFLSEDEILENLRDTIEKNNTSTEQILPIIYQPQAVFRVRAVTRCSATIPGHTEAVLHVNFSPNGKQLASGSGDTTVRLWDVDTCTPQATMKGHKNWVLAVAWSPCGRYVASGGMDNDVRIWCADEKDDGEDVVIDEDQNDAEHAETNAEKRRKRARREIHGQMKCKPLKGHKKWITGLAWEPLVCSYPRGSVVSTNNSDDDDKVGLKVPKELQCTRVASCSKDGTIRVWDIVRGLCTLTLSGHTAAIKGIRWGGSGLIYSCSQDRTIKVWETKQGKLVRQLDGHAHWVNTMSLNTDYALRSGPYNEKGVCSQNAQKCIEACHDKYEAVTKLTNGGELMCSGSDDFTCFLWSPSDSKKSIIRMTGHQQPVNFVLFSPDGRYIASASFDNSVRLWDGISGKFLTTFRGHVQSVYQVCWSADSRLLASSSQDSTIKLWDIRTKKMKIDLPGHADEVYAVDWSPDGIIVCSGGKDKVLKLWRR